MCVFIYVFAYLFANGAPWSESEFKEAQYSTNRKKTRSQPHLIFTSLIWPWLSPLDQLIWFLSLNLHFVVSSVQSNYLIGCYKIETITPGC